jgi:hypothetical protein
VSTETNGIPERRGTPRVNVANVDCRIVSRARVKLLDLSQSGALLATDIVLPVGAVARLSAVLGLGHFAPVVEVLRSGPARHFNARELGVQFQRMDDRSRRHLESFLTRAANA